MEKTTVINIGNKPSWTKFIPYLLILIFMGTTGFFVHKSRVTNEKLEVETKLGKALLDTITIYKNKNDELVSEKRTLQTEVKDLQDMTDYLTNEQKELLRRIDNLSRKNKIIAAALIKTRVELDSIRNGIVVVDTVENSLIISDSLPEIQYIFEVKKVKPLSLYDKPIFTIHKLLLPNTQFIEFHWKNDRKEGYPVSFSVSNSNKYFETVNIDSYIIPEIKKEQLKPNFWQKVGKAGKASLPYLIGGVVGAGITYVATN